MNEKIDALDSQLLLGRYRVVQKLGEGGMGTVHLARLEGAEGFTRPVVVKRMRSDIKSTDEGNRLFIREAKILSKMQHPGVVNIIDFGIEDGAHIMVLEYVHGYTLAPWLDYRYSRRRPLPVDLCLYIVRKVLDALHYAHHFDGEDGKAIQIVHRDVAPDNVLLSNKGYVHLLDFGVASMTGPDRVNSTKAGTFRGKLGYAAPETVHGEAATPRSDQYSAAALLLELLTQETPFFSDSMALTVQRMVNEIPDPPSKLRTDIPPGLDEVLAKALEKNPEKRFESAHEFAKALRLLQSQDDEEVAVLLKKVIREDFEVLPEQVGVDPLRLREEALARKLPPGVKTRPLDSIVQDDPRLSGILDEGRASSFSTQAPAGQKQLHGLLLGLLIVGGLIALGLGAAVALLSRGGSGEQVVVVGGENTGSGEQNLLRSSDASAPKTDNVGADLSPLADASELVNPASSSAPKPLTRQQKLSQAVQGSSGAFESCFVKHLEAAQQSPQAMLHFSVAKIGGKATVRVEPAALAAIPLGSCLKGVAEQVEFPELDEAVAFSVPVKARVARFQNQP